MSCLRHKLKLSQPLRAVRLAGANEPRVPESQVRAAEERSFRRGFEAGQKSMSEQLVQQRGQLLELQRGVFQSLQQALPEIVAHAERGLVKLALECAAKVLACMPISAEVIESTVREALLQLQGINQYRVLIHPDDLALLREIHSSVLPSKEDESIRFVADPAVSRGGCRVKTPFGEVDATREKKQEKLAAALQW